jgi:osmotically-inducible protein OsmY
MKQMAQKPDGISSRWKFLPAANRILLILLSASLLSGCAAAVVGGIAVATVVATDKRSTGTVIDDQTIEFTVVDRLYENESIDQNDHIKVEVYESVVLLVGEVTSEANRQLAGQIATDVKNVERVVNELQVASAANTADRLDNTWLTTKVNSALVKENPVSGFDATRIKVVSSGNNVYLMGLVSREEGNAVAEVARNVSGVEKVVKVFSYTD